MYCIVHQIAITELREVLLVILSGHVKPHHAQGEERALVLWIAAWMVGLLLWERIVSTPRCMTAGPQLEQVCLRSCNQTQQQIAWLRQVSRPLKFGGPQLAWCTQKSWEQPCEVSSSGAEWVPPCVSCRHLTVKNRCGGALGPLGGEKVEFQPSQLCSQSLPNSCVEHLSTLPNPGLVQLLYIEYIKSMVLHFSWS